MARRRRRRQMGGVRRVHDEERSARARADELVDAGGKHVGRVVAGLAAVLDDRAVDVERVVEEVRHVGRREGGPGIPARRYEGPPVRVEVLAEEAGAVAGSAEPGGERRPVVEIHEPTVRVDARRVRVETREDARPAGAAERIDRERVGEGDALADELGLDDRHGSRACPSAGRRSGSRRRSGVLRRPRLRPPGRVRPSPRPVVSGTARNLRLAGRQAPGAGPFVKTSIFWPRGWPHSPTYSTDSGPPRQSSSKAERS